MKYILLLWLAGLLLVSVGIASLAGQIADIKVKADQLRVISVERATP